MKKFISLILTIISMVVFSVSAFADEPMVTRGQAEHCVGTDGRVGQIICTSSRTYAGGTQKIGCQHGRVGYVDAVSYTHLHLDRKKSRRFVKIYGFCYFKYTL